MQKYLPKHLFPKSINLPSLLISKKKKDWQDKPISWPDIRKNTQNGHIYLLVDDRYPIGFTVTATDGYSVKIDGVAYADYNNQTQFSMADWSDYTDTEGYDISEPTGASKAHIIDIHSQTETADITAFHCDRVAASGTEQQGILWIHFNLNNQINLNLLSARSSYYENRIMKAITAKNNLLKVSTSLGSFAFNTQALEYVPIIDGNNETINCASMFAGSGVSKVILQNLKISASSSTYVFYNSKVEDLTFKNVDTSAVSNFSFFFNLAKNLKKLPNMNYSSATNISSFLRYNIALEDTVLDVSAATGLTKIDCDGNAANFMSGFKGLRVSSSAPFNNATSPQINVSYTGMDRTALVQLFNDLPTVSDGQSINIVGCTGTADLTAEDELIATNKGWTITE